MIDRRQQNMDTSKLNFCLFLRFNNYINQSALRALKKIKCNQDLGSYLVSLIKIATILVHFRCLNRCIKLNVRISDVNLSPAWLCLSLSIFKESFGCRWLYAQSITTFFKRVRCRNKTKCAVWKRSIATPKILLFATTVSAMLIIFQTSYRRIWLFPDCMRETKLRTLSLA